MGGQSITYSPTGGQIYTTSSVGYPKSQFGVTTLVGTVGTGQPLTGTNVPTVTVSAFNGAGGTVSVNPTTGETSAMVGVNWGPPGPGVSGDVSNPLVSVPPAIANVCLNAIPQGVPSYNISDGLQEYDEIPYNYLYPE